MRPRSTIPTPAPGTGTLAYLRVSTEDQARDEKASLSQQRDAIAAKARELGLVLMADGVFEDAGASGLDAEGRPAFLALLAHCQSHARPARAPGTVLALNDSRFGRFRDPEEATYHRVALRRVGWLVRFVESDDVQDPLGRSLMRAIGAGQASAYSHAVRANAKRGARGAAERGLWQNEAPIGYRRHATGRTASGRTLEVGQRKSEDETVRLTPGPSEEQELVGWIFAAYASGEHSLGSLARALVDRWPGRRWSRRAVQAILTNPAYTGDVVWLRRPHDREERKETPVRPASAWVVSRDAHPPLVTRQLFELAKARLKANRTERRRVTGGGYPLSGLLSCAQCGQAYIGGGGAINRRDAADPDRYRFYRCAGSNRVPCACPGRVGTLQKRWVEPVIVGEVAKAVADPRVQQLIADEIDRALATTGDSQQARRAALTSEHQQAEAQRDRIVSAIARGVLTDADAGPQLRRVKEQLAQLAAELERLRFTRRAVDRLQGERERLVTLAQDFASRARTMNGPALRELLRPWIQSAVVDKDRRTLTLHIRRVPLAGEFLLLESGPGRD